MDRFSKNQFSMDGFYAPGELRPESGPITQGIRLFATRGLGTCEWTWKKLGLHENLDLLTPYGNWWGFDKTEVCGKMVRNLFEPRISKFLSQRIVKSATFRIYGKLEFQCTRNGPQNPWFCPGSIQDTFILISTISHHQICQNHIARNNNLENPEIWKSWTHAFSEFWNPGILEPWNPEILEYWHFGILKSFVWGLALGSF